MSAGERLSGRLASGVGEGKSFTRLPWARAQFMAKLGIDPFPGTLNLILEEAAERAKWLSVKAGPYTRIVPPDPKFCDGRCFPARIEDRIAAAIVVPEVPGYPEHQIELIAAENVRAALGVSDGDRVTITIVHGGST